MGYHYGSSIRAMQGLPPAGDSSEEEEQVVAAYSMGLLPIGLGKRKRSRYSVPRKVVKRKIREGWHRLKVEYFDPDKIYPDAYFRRRFRMLPRLFRRIADNVAAHYSFFQEKENAAGKMGANPYQKMLAALKMLCTGCTPDSLDSEFQMSRSLISQSFKLFIRAIVKLYEKDYLRSPTEAEIQVLLAQAEERGFPGMLGSIDCMHWVWENCPVAWQGEHRGHTHKPTIILEAVAGPDLRIWHAYVGLPGALNDINVLQRSHVFDNIKQGTAPAVHFTVNGTDYDMGYYLADGIYPDWATLIKGVPEPVSDKQKLFTLVQAAYRKDVERAFGVLQAKFNIVKGPCKMYFVEDMKYIMKCCIILHNMAIEDERGFPVPCVEDFNDGAEPHLLPKDAPTIEQLIENHKKIQNKAIHTKLQEDLMEHVWSKFGHAWRYMSHVCFIQFHLCFFC